MTGCTIAKVGILKENNEGRWGFNYMPAKRSDPTIVEMYVLNKPSVIFLPLECRETSYEQLSSLCDSDSLV